MFPVGSRSRNRGRGFAFNRGAKIPPSFVFDFLRGSLDSRITYTGSNGTLFNSSGTLTAATTNVARFDYDPSTLIARGLLIEEARTNLFLNSLLNGTSLSTQNVTTTATPYTISFYGTGTITLTGTSTAGPIVGTGVYPNRVTLTFTPSAGTLTCTVSGSVQYAQIEAGSFATSFIPTAGATVTRAADIASITGANFTSFWNATQGTFVARWMLAKVANGGNQMVVRASDGSYNNQIAALNTISTGFASIATASGGVFDGAASAPVALVDNVFSTSAASYSATGISISKDGAAVVSDNTLTFPTGMTRLDIGGDHAGANHFGSGWLQSLVYYPQGMPTLLRSLSA